MQKLVTQGKRMKNKKKGPFEKCPLTKDKFAASAFYLLSFLYHGVCLCRYSSHIFDNNLHRMGGRL